MLRREGRHVVPRRRPILVVMLLVLDGRLLGAIRFRVLVAIVVVLVSRRWIGRLEQLVERGCRASGLRYALPRHVVSLLGKHRAWRSHHGFRITMPELAPETVRFGVAIGMVVMVLVLVLLLLLF